MIHPNEVLRVDEGIVRNIAVSSRELHKLFTHVRRRECCGYPVGVTKKTHEIPLNQSPKQQFITYVHAIVSPMSHPHTGHFKPENFPPVVPTKCLYRFAPSLFDSRHTRFRYSNGICFVNPADLLE